MRKIGLLCQCFCLLFLLTGCWDRIEVNDLAFVVATGVDKGENHQYRISVQVPLPSSLGGTGSSGGGGGTSGEGPFFVALGTGVTQRQGIEDIQLRTSRKLYFAHRRVLIIGENLAKEGIMETLKAVFIQPQSRISTYLLVSKGDAVNLLNAHPRLEQFSGEAIREMAKTSLNNTVMDALEDLNRPGKDVIVPFIETTGTIKKEKNGKEIRMESFAIFKDDKLSFTTNKQESQGILWLLERMKKKSLSFTVSKNKEIPVQIVDNHIKLKFHIVNGLPTFDLYVWATGTLLENEPNLRIEDPETYYMVIGKMEREIKNQIKSILDHSLTTGTDLYGFGWYLYRNHYQMWEEKWKNDWNTTLSKIKVNVKVDADIQRTTNTGSIEKG